MSKEQTKKSARANTAGALKYHEGIGRRKTAVARVRLTKGTGKAITVDGRKLEDYFPVKRWYGSAIAPLERLGLEEKYDISVWFKGGGIRAQAEAVQLGIARALVAENEDNKAKLKPYGFLTRDPRMVERKKPGLKKARRAPQWSKR